MPRTPNGPTLTLRAGRYRARWTARGQRHEISLGADKQKAQRSFGELVKRLAEDPNYVGRESGDLLLAELCESFLAAKPFAPLEFVQYQRATVILLSRHGETTCEDFGPRALGEWRDELASVADAEGKPVYSRSYIAKLLRIVRAIYGWGAETERLDANLWHALKAVRGPRPEQGKPKRQRVTVSDDRLEQVLEELPDGARRLCLALRWTGARPSELLRLRLIDLDRTRKEAWVLRLASHKTSRHGKTRQVIFGPRSQAAIDLDLSPTDYQFPPCPARGRFAGRGTGCYDSHSLGWAIRRACERLGCEPFGSYAFRHTRLEEVRDKHGIEAAQAVGGQARINTTEIYAPVALERAIEAAKGSG